MLKQGFTFSIIQTISVLLSLFILSFALAGSHGKLYFSNVGGTVAVVITIILSLPLVYLFIQRDKLQKRKFLFIIASLLFLLCIATIYVGLPNMTKQFIIDKNNIDTVSIYKNNDLTIDLKFEEEMFDRVGIEASINKTSNIEFTKLDMTIYNAKGAIVKPVFRNSVLDSLHHERIQMDSFFQMNAYTKLNHFFLTGQYSIENIDSLEIEVDFIIRQNGQTISRNKKMGIKIANHLVLERLIEY
jgi:hypothetical protein